jgi:5-methylcytosine-specific restriction endonuclease McrA
MAFTDKEIQAVWEKGKIVKQDEKDSWRQDECTAWISRDKYGNRNSDYGWEIDHIIPVSKGGTDALSNLRPLQWENNASKSDGKLVCVIKGGNGKNERIR